MRQTALAAGALWLAAASSLPAQTGTKAEHFAFATLDNGASLGFALLRTGAPPDAGAIGKAVFPRSNSVSRVLVDESGSTYFGYRLEVQPYDKVRQAFKVSMKPLAPGIENELQRGSGCPHCPPPTLLAQPPRFPAPQMVADGEVFTLDLLINPTTGERIADAVKISRTRVTPEAMQTVAARLTEALLAVQRADNLAARNSQAAAVVEYGKALAIHPNDAVVRNKLGICLQRLQKNSQAEKQYNRAVSINPNFAEAWNNLGSLEHARGRYEQAIKYYRKAIDKKPGFATAYKNLGSAYFALKRFDAGYEAYLTAYRLDPTVLEAAGTLVVTGAGVSSAVQNYYFARISASNGQIDVAFIFLRRAFEDGFKDVDSISREADFQAVVADPRFKQLLREFGR